MIYQFKRPDGTVAEAWFHNTEAPDAGETVEIDGQPCIRIVSTPQIRSEFKPYTTKVLPKHIPLPGLKYNRRGNPIIESHTQERELAKAHGYEWE